MRRILALFVMVLAGSIGNAQASTVTFEDLAIDDGAIVGGDRTSGGFFFDTAADHSHIVQAASSWNTGNGTHFMMLDDFFGPDATTFSQVGGAPFVLSSIDISEAHPDSFFSARQIAVTGNLFGGGTISTVLALDNNSVNGVPGNYFQTFAFNAAWSNLSSVRLSGGGALAGGGNYFAIDNVVVTAAVPEPGTLTLLGLGSAYLIRRRRRNAR